MVSEDTKERVLSWLNTYQRTKSAWFTASRIAKLMGIGHATAKESLDALALDGFLHIRHEPSMPNVLNYRLKREGDQ